MNDAKAGTGLEVQRITLRCKEEGKSAGTTWGVSDLCLRKVSPCSSVAAIEKAEKQRYKWHAQDWRHEGRVCCGRGVSGSKDWAHWKGTKLGRVRRGRRMD